jgi:hypothetical protein
MPARRKGDVGRDGRRRLLLVLFFFFFIFVIFGKIAVFSGFFLLLIIFFIEVVGNEVEMHGMRLRNLELGLALGAAQDFAFFDFVLVHINFSGTLRAADHGSILRRNVRRAGLPTDCTAAMAYYIPRCPKSTLMRGAAASIVNRSRAEFLK